MTATENDPDRRSSKPRTTARGRGVRVLALAAVATLTAGAIVSAGGGTASAAETIRAQAVGRFIDGTVGGMPVQSVVDLVDARAKAAPDSEVRNPLEAKLLGQLDVPLGDAFKLPGGGVFQLGAANQIAIAKSDRTSAGASGAILNSGAVELTDKNKAFPSNATIDLSSDAFGSIPIPGLPTLPSAPAGADKSFAALGGLKGNIGAVAGIVGTDKNGNVITPRSQIANVTLTLNSPALGALLTQLKSVISDSVLSKIIPTLPVGIILPAGCTLTATSPTDPIPLDNGGVVLDPTNAGITIDLAKLVKQLLDKDISNLDTSNFDLVDFLVTNLPKILSTGLQNLVTGITKPLEDQFKKCIPTGPVGDILNQVLKALDDNEKQVTTALGKLSAQFSDAATGPLGMLADGLKNVVDIGLNVQSGPGIQPREKTHPFESDLAATPDQATPVVKNQTLVRAIEIDLLDASSGLPAPGTNSVHERRLAGAQDAAPRAVAPGDGAAVIALGNAAAGPSALPAGATPAPTPTPSTGVPGTNIPTGVPAGAAGHDTGSPLLPIALLLLGLMVAGGGVLTYRYRGKFSR